MKRLYSSITSSSCVGGGKRIHLSESIQLHTLKSGDVVKMLDGGGGMVIDNNNDTEISPFIGPQTQLPDCYLTIPRWGMIHGEVSKYIGSEPQARVTCLGRPCLRYHIVDEEMSYALAQVILASTPNCAVYALKEGGLYLNLY